MKTTILLAALLVPVLLAPASHAGSTVTVAFHVTLGNHLLPSTTTCAVTVPASSTVAAVLDQAQADGCIGSWTYDTFPGFGRYVTCIDDLCQLPAGNFWALYTDEHLADLGIDSYVVSNGEDIEFVYADWVTPFV